MIGGPENFFKYEFEEIICLLILQLIWLIVLSIFRFSCEKIGGPPYCPREKLSGPPFEACEKIGGPPWKSSAPPPPIFNERSLNKCKLIHFFIKCKAQFRSYQWSNYLTIDLKCFFPDGWWQNTSKHPRSALSKTAIIDYLLFKRKSGNTTELKYECSAWTNFAQQLTWPCISCTGNIKTLSCQYLY